MGRQPRVDVATADGHDRHVPSGTKDLLAVGHEGVYEWVASHLVADQARFLDLGCGTGYGSALVVAAGAIYDGADSSPAAVGYARNHYAGPGVRFFTADLLEPLPGEIVPASYDVVFSSEVLEHVVDPFAFVDVMARFLRPDGACFVGTPNRLWSRANMPDHGLLARSHVMEFTPPALEALLRTRFDDVSILYRMFPSAAIPAVVVPPVRPRVVRGALAFAREVAPSGLDRVRRAVGRRNDGRAWASDDIVWLAPDDPRLDPERAVGLAAVCRVPRS